MNKEDFLKHIKKGKTQIFFMKCRMSFPFTFVVHTWIVIQRNGRLTRYDIWWSKNRSGKSYGHLHRNLYAPWVWVRTFIGKKADNVLRNNAEIIECIEGKGNSPVDTIAMSIQKNVYEYPFCFEYAYFPGPNSNTFTQWIIDTFKIPEVKLPRNAIGKNYAIAASRKPKEAQLENLQL